MSSEALNAGYLRGNDGCRDLDRATSAQGQHRRPWDLRLRDGGIVTQLRYVWHSIDPLRAHAATIEGDPPSEAAR